MTAQRVLRTFIILVILLTNIGCDQISKSAVRKSLYYGESIGLNNYITLTKVENSGAFLSLGNSWPEPVRIFLLSILPLLILGYGLFFLMTKINLSKISVTALCFVIGGGIGNIFDRIVYGSVTDFLHIDFVIFETGIFNMADVSIMTGMFLILITPFFKKDQNMTFIS